jgi:hypothetical protein
MLDELLTITEAARLLGVPFWRVRYAHASGKVKEPRQRLGATKAYSSEDIKALRAHFASRKEARGQ